MQIIPATKSLNNQLYAIYDACRIVLQQEGIYQWTDKYPAFSTIETDIAYGHLYVFVQYHQCIGAICLNEEQSPEYAPLPWQDNGKILVVHRLAVHPLSQKQGIARKLMDFAEEFAANNGYTSIRLDAYSGNHRSLKFYENRGYHKAGEVYFPGRTAHFNCYEKLL